MANLQIIRTLSKNRGMTLKKLSELLGISENGLQRIIKTNSTKIETLEKIAKILNVSITVFFPDPGPSYFDFSIPYFLWDMLPSILSERIAGFYNKIYYWRDYYLFKVFDFIRHHNPLFFTPPENFGDLYIPFFPFTADNKPVDLLSYSEIQQLEKGSIFYLDASFERLTNKEQSALRNCKYLFKGFYYSLFYLNFLNIKEYIADNMVTDNEILEHWTMWNDLLKKHGGDFHLPSHKSIIHENILTYHRIER